MVFNEVWYNARSGGGGVLKTKILQLSPQEESEHFGALDTFDIRDGLSGRSGLREQKA